MKKNTISAVLLTTALLAQFLTHVPIVHATGSLPINIVASDTFGKPDQTNWGAATDGVNTWGSDASTNSAFSISSQTGAISGTGYLATGTLGQSSYPDSDTLVLFKSTAFSSSNVVGAIARWTDNGNFYEAYLDGSSLKVDKVVGGTATNLASTSFAASANEVYDIRLDVVGTTVEAKAWDELAQGEPSAWAASATDSSLTDGSSGVVSNIASGTTATFTDTEFGEIDDSTASTSDQRIPFFYDSFERGDQTHWGTPDEGIGTAWDGCIGTSSQGSISNDTGIMTGNGGGTCNGVTDVTVSDADIFATANATTIGANDRFGLVARQISAGNLYSLYIDGSNLYLKKSVSGTSTTLASATFSASANVDYNFEFKLSGTSLQANVWDATTDEPSGWMVSATDSTYSSGEPGIFTFTKTNGNIVSYSYLGAYNN